MIARLRPWARTVKRAMQRPLRQRAFYPHVRATDSFLVTYPKSGTTWVGFLLANLLKRDPGAVLNLHTSLDHVPDVNEAYYGFGTLRRWEHLPDPRVFMCHAVRDQALPRVVYVVRDPRDVMVSYWHHKRLTTPGFDQSMADFVRAADHWPCSWDEHVAGWLFPPKHTRLLVVKYEALQTDARAVLHQVLQFLELPRTPAEIERAVEASRFDRMRSAEERFGVIGAAGDKAERFVRRGQVGGWRDELDEATERALEQRYGAVMRQLGYEPRHGR
jgi:estrone sulfotransferase